MKNTAQRTFLLSAIMILILFAFPITALADGEVENNELTQTVHGYQITLVFENHASLGENKVILRVRDAHNMPVAGVDPEISILEVQPESTEAHSMSAAEMAGMDDGNAGTKTNDMNNMPGMDNTNHDSAQPGSENDMTGMEDMNSMPGHSDQAPSTGHAEMGMVALTSGRVAGEYEGHVTIENTGDLNVRLHLNVHGELIEVDFPIHVAETQSGSLILAGFFVINAAIISTALILKPKPSILNLSKKG